MPPPSAARWWTRRVPVSWRPSGGSSSGSAPFWRVWRTRSGNIFLLYLGFGFIAGLGNGFGYVTPIATLIRWFPDKRGLVTGLAVMGFGFGAFFMGKIAPGMVNGMGVATTFYILGVIFLILVTAAAQFYKNPPKGWLPAGFTPPKTTASAAQSFTFDEAKKTPQWWMLWACSA